MTYSQILAILPKYLVSRFADNQLVIWGNMILDMIEEDCNLSDITEEAFVAVQDGERDYQLPSIVKQPTACWITDAYGFAVRSPAGKLEFQKRPSNGTGPCIKLRMLPSLGGSTSFSNIAVASIDINVPSITIDLTVHPELETETLVGMAMIFDNGSGSGVGRVVKSESVVATTKTIILRKPTLMLGHNLINGTPAAVSFHSEYFIVDFIRGFTRPTAGSTDMVDYPSDLVAALVAGIRWKAEAHEEDGESKPSKLKNEFREELRRCRNVRSRNVNFQAEPAWKMGRPKLVQSQNGTRNYWADMGGSQ